jgi:hypothetical protein
MDQTRRVRGREAPPRPAEDLQDLAPRTGGRRQPLPQVGAVHQLHGHEDLVPEGPTSCTVTTLGWESRAMAWASRWSRVRSSLPTRPARRSLTATLRSNSGS